MAPPRPLTTARAQRRRAELLDAAEERFLADEYDAVSVDAIAAAAGVSHGLLFQYFGSKKGIYLAVMARLLERFNAQIQAPDGAGGALPVLSAYLDWAAEHPAAYRSLMSGPFAEVRELVARARDAGMRRMAAGLQVDLDADPALRIALLGWTGLNERATLAWLDAPEVPRDEVLRTISEALLVILRSRGLIER